MDRILEICAQDIVSVEAAAREGAHRIELCSSLETGGITPSIGLVNKARSYKDLKVFVLIRPRSGHFTYSPEEYGLMKEDIKECLDLGVDGIVAGFLDEDGKIDQDKSGEILELCGNAGFTFHRAFDLLEDQREGLEVLKALRVKRVLTSGQERTAEMGIDRIKELHELAGNEIVIMPGSGIHSGNIMDFAALGIKEFHLSAQRSQPYEVEYQGRDLFSTTFRSSNAMEIKKCLNLLSTQ